MNNDPANGYDVLGRDAIPSTPPTSWNTYAAGRWTSIENNNNRVSGEANGIIDEIANAGDIFGYQGGDWDSDYSNWKDAYHEYELGLMSAAWQSHPLTLNNLSLLAYDGSGIPAGSPSPTPTILNPLTVESTAQPSNPPLFHSGSTDLNLNFSIDPSDIRWGLPQIPVLFRAPNNLTGRWYNAYGEPAGMAMAGMSTIGSAEQDAVGAHPYLFVASAALPLLAAAPELFSATSMALPDGMGIGIVQNGQVIAADLSVSTSHAALAAQAGVLGADGTLTGGAQAVTWTVENGNVSVMQSINFPSSNLAATRAAIVNYLTALAGQ